MQGLFLIFGAFSFIVCGVAVLSIWRGFVATKLWLWFVVPHFGLAPMPIHIAIGLSLLVGLYSASRNNDKDEESYRSLAYSLLFPAMSLLFGWIVLSLNT